VDNADLTVPPGARAGLIPLHPANDPSRGSLLFADLAEQLPPLGVAVLRYDRRPGEDIPLEAQADDALEAAADLRAAVGDPALPIVLWGYSQGAWACLIAAARWPGIAGLALLGASGVSPAQQMRYTTERQLREAGYGEEDVADLRRLRTEGERYIRREQGGSAFQPVIDEYAGRPWFPLAFIPREVPETPEPWEMDFDPAMLLGQITCPVLAVYGDDDRWVPIDPSIAVFSALPQLEVVRISGGGHAPTTDREGGGEVLSQYRDALASWLSRTVLR
jgi:pimeloyl-ACP methyl ester carboxylesterase